jgi:hypothetical protein
MLTVNASIVATFFTPHDVTLAAVWDGGKWCNVHRMNGGRYGAVVERWDMIDDATGKPGIECTPAALAELVRYRLEHHRQVVELGALDAERFVGNRLPAFSRN